MKFLSNVYALLMGNSSEKAIANILALAETNAKESGYFYPKLANTTVKEKINVDALVASKLWDVSMKLAKLN